MIEVFKVGNLVEIHLIGGTKIRGDVTEQPTSDYVCRDVKSVSITLPSPISIPRSKGRWTESSIKISS